MGKLYKQFSSFLLILLLRLARNYSADLHEILHHLREPYELVSPEEILAIRPIVNTREHQQQQTYTNVCCVCMTCRCRICTVEGTVLNSVAKQRLSCLPKMLTRWQSRFMKLL
ncbi:Uncharacterised protein r2_g447 [Pycnogonum litorale]